MSASELKRNYSMGFSRKDFLERLHKQKTFTDFQVKDNNILVNWKSGAVSIELGKEGQRRLGSLYLTTLDIQINLQALAENDRKSFLSEFTIAFHKGGG